MVLVDIINCFFKNEYVRYYFIILVVINISYTLQPIPTTLNKLFKESNIFKFIVLFLGLILIQYPVDTAKIYISISIPIIILMMFGIMRNIETGYPFYTSLILDKDKMILVKVKSKKDKRRINKRISNS